MGSTRFTSYIPCRLVGRAWCAVDLGLSGRCLVHELLCSYVFSIRRTSLNSLQLNLLPAVLATTAPTLPSQSSFSDIDIRQPDSPRLPFRSAHLSVLSVYWQVVLTYAMRCTARNSRCVGSGCCWRRYLIDLLRVDGHMTHALDACCGCCCSWVTPWSISPIDPRVYLSSCWRGGSWFGSSLQLERKTRRACSLRACC